MNPRRRINSINDLDHFVMVVTNGIETRTFRTTDYMPCAIVPNSPEAIKWTTANAYRCRDHLNARPHNGPPFDIVVILHV